MYTMRTIGSVLVTIVAKRGLESRVFKRLAPAADDCGSLLKASHVLARHAVNIRLVVAQFTAVTRSTAAACNLSIICRQNLSRFSFKH